MLQGKIHLQDIKSIRSIPLSFYDKSDALKWMCTKFGVYSVKSGYFISKQHSHCPAIFQPSSSSFISRKLWNQVWKGCFSPKVRVFMWKVCSNALATKLNLYKRNCSTTSLCPICGQ